MPLTSQNCVGPECPWVGGLPPPCWRQPVPGLPVMKVMSHASWCHRVSLHYHEAWVSQHHVPPSSHRDGLDAACGWPVGFSQASSLLAQLADALLLLPLLLAGGLMLGLCHRPWPMRLLQPGRWARRDQYPGPVLQTIICPVTISRDCFQLLLGMVEAVWFLPIFPTFFPQENCT